VDTFIQLREAQREAGEKKKQLKMVAEELERRDLIIAALEAQLAETRTTQT